MTLKEQAQRLYMQVFSEDSEAFAKSFTDRYFDNCCRYTLTDGKITSMLYLLDCTVFDGEKTYPAKYLYAAATHPEHRNKGLMSSLVSSVLSEEKIIVTKPATDELFSFYEKFGFTVCSFKDEKKHSFQNKIAKEEYKALRKMLLENIPHIILADEDFSLEGFDLYGDSTFVAAVDPDTNTVKEYIKSGESPLSDKAPFAMWNKKDASTSLYFGISMD